MGLFSDRSEAAYSRANEAVRNGTATAQDCELNRKAASLAGSMGNQARQAQQEAKSSSSGGWLFS